MVHPSPQMGTQLRNSNQVRKKEQPLAKISAPCYQSQGAGMIRLLAKIARAVGFLLLAVLAIWFLPVWLWSRCGGPGGCPESNEPEYQYYKRLKQEKRLRWHFNRKFRQWQDKQKKERWDRIEKIRKTFY